MGAPANISDGARKMADVQTVVRDYCAAWAEPDPVARMELLTRSWSEAGVYQDPRSDVCGREALSAHIDALFQQRPGAKVVLTSGADHHHGKIYFTWKAVAADGSTIVEGRDFGEIDADGRIKLIVGFFGQPPSMSE
jgi:hypothetical protein